MNSLLITLNALLIMTHAMPTLPYAQDALEPAMGRETIEYHYGKHLQTYVNNLNNLVKGTEFENATLDEIVKKSEGPIFNNGGQVWNHTMFFLTLSPDAKTKPTGKLMDAIERDFGSYDAFIEQFNKTATGVFGSGWAWLVADDSGKLSIVATSNAGNPLRDGKKPLMTCDVWEHSYYLDYRNSRPDYMKAFWTILDWSIVEKRYEGK